MAVPLAFTEAVTVFLVAPVRVSVTLPAGEMPLALVTVRVSVTVLATFVVLPVAFTRPDTLLAGLGDSDRRRDRGGGGVGAVPAVVAVTECRPTGCEGRVQVALPPVSVAVAWVVPT